MSILGPYYICITSMEIYLFLPAFMDICIFCFVLQPPRSVIPLGTDGDGPYWPIGPAFKGTSSKCHSKNSFGAKQHKDRIENKDVPNFALPDLIWVMEL